MSELNTANAGVLVHRVAQIRGGMGKEAREASRDAVEYLNTQHAGVASVTAFEETFGTRDKLHWILNMRSFTDYAQLNGSEPGGVFTNPRLEEWDRLFVEGSVRDTVMQPHRWGMHGTLTEAMVADPSVHPNVQGEIGPMFQVTPASAQTEQSDSEIIHSGNAGLVMRRTADFSYSFREEARVFARTIAEMVNLSSRGQATVFLYEEDFGRMDRVHWLIHLRSMEVYYLLMGLDSRTDADAPRVTYLQDWISMDKGGGSWDRMLIQGSVRDLALTPQR